MKKIATPGRRHSVLAAVSSLGLLLVSNSGHGQSTNWPGDRWPTANDPSVMAMDVVQLQSAEDYSERPGPNTGAGFVTRGGVLVYSWGDLTPQYDVKSVTQAIVGTSLLGFAIDDGLLALSDFAQPLMVGFGVPAEANTATGWLPEITIEQLATESSGFDGTPGFCDLVFRPATEWAYSLCGVNWLGDVLTTTFQQDLFVVARDRLFTPLGIDSNMLIWRNPRYRLPIQLPVAPGVSVTRRFISSGIFATQDALARFGLLYLREGDWRGQRVLSQSFVQEARVPRASIASLPVRLPERFFNSASHFGLMWWNNGDGQIAGVPTDAYWAWGYQHDSLVVVIPSLDLVVVRTGRYWRQSACPATVVRDVDFCPDYGVLEDFLQPIVASVNTSVVLTNAAPVADAGADQVADLASGGTISLTGAATDDGLPGSPLGFAWSVVSGPAPAPTFTAPTAANTDVTFSALGTYVLELSADDSAITGYDHVTVTAVDSSLPSIPTVTISASPPLISAGTTTTLSWSSTNATSCEASGAWTGTKATSGSEETAVLSVTSTFNLACTGPGGTSLIQSVTVEVEAPPPPTDVTLTAQPATIAPGGSATLTWTTVEAEQCTASGGWTGAKSFTGGSETVTPAATSTYTLRCVGTSEDTASATVTVSAPPPPPPPPGGGGGGGGGVTEWWLIAGLLALGARARSWAARGSASA